MLLFPGSPYSGRDSYSRSTDYSSTLYKPVFNQYLTADYQPAPYKPKPALFTEREPTKERTPFFLQPILPRFGYNPNRRERDIPATISSHANSSFPFRKYRSDFVPYAPYKSLHDSGIKYAIASKPITLTAYLAKYTPNPDWLSFRPWGYKFRKARCVFCCFNNLNIMNMSFDLKMHLSGMFMCQRRRTPASRWKLKE